MNDKSPRGDASRGAADKRQTNQGDGSELNPHAPVTNVTSSIRDATDDEKPDPTSVVQIEEVDDTDDVRGSAHQKAGR